MIIGIDAHNIRGDGGSVVHLKELLNNSSPIKDKFNKIVVWVNEDTYKKLPQKSFIEYIVLPESNVIKALMWQKYKLGKEAKKKKCDILFFPGGIYLGKFKPFVVFAQSMLPFDYKVRKIYSSTILFWILVFKKRLMLFSFNKADRIIFVSKAIKEQVERVSKKTFKNSKVIHHGVSRIFISNVKRQSINELVNRNITIKVLTVSSHAKHKNLITLVKAINELRAEGKKIELKIVGPSTKYGTKELLKLIKKIDENNSFIALITDEKYENLPIYYNEAHLFILPSICESFGLPLKETIANELPVIYNSLASFKEIIDSIKPKTLYLEFSNSINSLKEKILEMLNGKHAMNTYIGQNDNLGWDKCTRETFRYIKELEK